LISSGDIDHSAINYETYVFENANELFSLISHMANNEAPDQPFRCIALDLKTLVKLKELLAVWDEIIEENSVCQKK
jgi:hypothetical protein